MHIAIHNWMRAEPLEQTAARISRQGYHALEIQGAPELYDLSEVRELLKKYNLKCWGSVTLMMEERNLVARDEAQRATSIQYVKDIITMVKELDGHMVSVVPGTVGKIVPDGRPKEEWDWAVEALKDCYEYAETSGVLIGIEPINRFETYFINRGSQALALAEAVGPNCGVCLDIFHMNLEESDYQQTIRDCRHRLVGFHVADNNRFAPGMGTLNWKEIISTLKEVGYDGALSVEFCPPLDRTPANPYPGSIDEKPEGLTPEQLKFLEDHGSSAFTEEFYSMLTQRSIDTLLPLIT
ncbi:MAG: sugar phosphate isomerase/epimerase [Cyclobacteriaceae bacterium]|nr:sugar phosphate isomerase/epimerase [Cyclobacteriaceae bacterium]